jgi:hypothetical protein
MKAKVLLLALIYDAFLYDTSAVATETSHERKLDDENPPNILVFLVDDLGWTQVGYHAAPLGNDEVKTPNIDHYASSGIEMNRGYMTPWVSAFGFLFFLRKRGEAFFLTLTSFSLSFSHTYDIQPFIGQCGPSRAAIQTGRTNSYNKNISSGRHPTRSFRRASSRLRLFY